MLYGFLVTLFVILCILLILIILMQKSKGSIGIGSLGGGAQMLFGATGGQDLFQKITWIMGALFMGGSLVLALMKVSQSQTSRYLTGKTKLAQEQIQAPVTPIAPAIEPANEKGAIPAE